MTQNQINKYQRKRLQNILFALFLVLIGIWTGAKQYQKALLQSQANTAGLIAGMQQYKNKMGQEISTKQSLILSNRELQSIHAADSSVIKQLQKIVNKNTQSALIVTVATTQTVAATTSVIPNATDSCKPTYKSLHKDQYSEHRVTANADSTHIECIVYNQFDFTDEWHKEGALFHRRSVLETKVKNKNTNTHTIGLQSYSRPIEKRKIWPWLIGGFVAGAGTTLYLFNK